MAFTSLSQRKKVIAIGKAKIMKIEHINITKWRHSLILKKRPMEPINKRTEAMRKKYPMKITEVAKAESVSPAISDAIVSA